MAPRIWPGSATSPSIWCAKSPTSDPSSDAASAPLGTQNTCWKYCGRCDVNLASLPFMAPIAVPPFGAHFGRRPGTVASVLDHKYWFAKLYELMTYYEF